MEARGRVPARQPPDPLFLVLKLVPFFASCALYFYLWLPPNKSSWCSALIKCLPTLFLALFVHNNAPEECYSRFIWLGLLCSSVGDIFLLCPKQFALGLSVFAVAHFFYLRALGWRPVRLVLLRTVVAVFSLYFGLLEPHLPSSFHLPVVFYAAILGLMLWRALARGRLAALGGLFFSVSFAVQAWSTFVPPMRPYRVVTMVTYYTGQALLALSTMESRA